MANSNAVLIALYFGLLSALALPIGAALGLYWRPSRRTMAFLLAFGGGALLAALTIELVAPGVEKGWFFEIAIGAILGGVLFKLLDLLLNNQGGYLRKPSTAMNYWHNQAHKKFRRMLRHLHRVHAVKNLSTETLDQLLNIVTIREYPKGATLYRKGEPAFFLYVIKSGRVALTEPGNDKAVFASLGADNVFGRMSFFTGVNRATDAHTTEQSTLLCIPRDDFFALLPHCEDLRDYVIEQIQDQEVSRYLHKRQKLSPEIINQWQHNAAQQLEQSSTLSPPIEETTTITPLLNLLRLEQRTGFFNALSTPTLERIARHMVQQRYPPGHCFFNHGDWANECFVLHSGSVYLVDPEDRNHPSIIIRAGEVFGAFSFLTSGTHTMTAFGSGDTQVSVLRSDDFQTLWQHSDEIKHHLSDFLQHHQVEEYLTERQKISPSRVATWVNNATKNRAGGPLFPSVSDITQRVATHSGAPMAMYLGILLDGIPESLVIGAGMLNHSSVSLSLIGGLFLANFPEALSSSAGMKDQGMGAGKIMLMWISLMILTGIGAALGVLYLDDVSPGGVAFIKGVAAGAMLTMIAETMLPEAYHNGGGIVGLSTLMGFLTAIFVNHI